MNCLFKAATVIAADGRILENTDVRVSGERIQEIGIGLSEHSAETVIVADRRVLMPSFVDAHTHALWAGDRLDEFELKLRGATYLEILKAGGGILSTVRAVRETSEDELSNILTERLAAMLREGTTTLEIKSGYGLRTRDELKMLRAIARSAQRFSGSVSPTALLGHAVDPDSHNFTQTVLSETLPAVHSEFPGITVDCYCEEGAWSLNDCRRLMEKALELGHPVRIHADQFRSLGGVQLGVELGAQSVDHLEASTPEDLRVLASSHSYGVMLPASGFHLDGRYADGRTFLDAAGKLVLASNFNPGSSPTSSMPFVIGLAVRKLGLTISEAIIATTRAPALLLGYADRGLLEIGARADLVLLRHRDVRLLAYELGGNPIDLVMCRGELVN